MRGIVLIATGLGLLAACSRSEPLEVRVASEAPLAPPNLERAHELFTESCSPCHGETGRGDGWRAKEIAGPKPRDFHSPAQIAILSPARAFQSITSGVPQTAMGPFGLADDERWALAYYVLSLRHEPEQAERGRELALQRELRARNARALAGKTDDELSKELAEQGLAAEEVGLVLADYRRNVAFGAIELPMSAARRALAETMSLYRKGNHQRAKQQARSFHLRYIKPQLAVLALRNDRLALAVDQGVRELRSRIDMGQSAVVVEEQANLVAAALDASDGALDHHPSSTVVAAQAASIVLASSLDGSLALLLLLLLATRRGADPSEQRYGVVGVLLGLASLLVGYATWPQLEATMSGAGPAYLMAVVSGAIVVGSMLLLPSAALHLSRSGQARIEAPPSWRLFLLVFAATMVAGSAVRFVPGVSVLAHSSQAAVLGFLAAVAAAVAFVWLLLVLIRRLGADGRMAVIACSATTLAVTSAGAITRALQDVGVIAATPAGSMRSSWFCFWPTSEGLLSQTVVAGLCLALLLATAIVYQRRV